MFGRKLYYLFCKLQLSQVNNISVTHCLSHTQPTRQIDLHTCTWCPTLTYCYIAYKRSLSVWRKTGLFTRRCYLCSERGREGRLIRLISDTTGQTNTAQFGFGIDEDTALVITHAALPLSQLPRKDEKTAVWCYKCLFTKHIYHNTNSRIAISAMT